MTDFEPAIRRYMEWMYRESDISRQTLNDYARYLTRLSEWTRDLRRGPLEALTEDDILAYLFEQNDVADGTLTGYYAAIRGFFRWLYVTKQRPDNPAAEIRQRRRGRRQIAERAGQLSQKIASLSPEDQLVVQFLRQLDKGVSLEEAFSIKTEPPVGSTVTVQTQRRSGTRQIQLSERSQELLDRLGGELPDKRTFQRHTEKVGFKPNQLRRSSRAAVEVELSPSAEELIHSRVARGDFEESAQRLFKEIENRLRQIVGSDAWGARLIDQALGESGVLASAFARPPMVTEGRSGRSRARATSRLIQGRTIALAVASATTSTPSRTPEGDQAPDMGA